MSQVLAEKPYYERRYYVFGNTGRTRDPTPEERTLLAQERETGERILISDEFPLDDLFNIIESEYTDSETAAFAKAKEYLDKGYNGVFVTDNQSNETFVLGLCCDCGALIENPYRTGRCEKCNAKEAYFEERLRRESYSY